MSHAKPNNFPWVSPYIAVKDVRASLAFYEKAFDFVEQKDSTHEQDGVAVHGEMRYRDMVIMVGVTSMYEVPVRTPAASDERNNISLYVYCDDVDAFFKHAVAAGATPGMEPQDAFWGDRMCSVKDIDGYEWCFATHKP